MASMGVQLQAVNGDNAYPRPYYRIGDILESTNPNNPGDDGYIGTWELYGKGRVTVCIDTNDSNFNAVEKTIGSSTHKLTITQIPAHTHTYGTNKSSNLAGSGNEHGTAAQTNSYTTSSTGGGQPHNNIQKSIVVYRWRRIA